MKKIAILQSNYIPWKGVFDMINEVDEFVFFEDVQFTNRDWRTRNLIKTPNGNIWLSVPIKKAPRDTMIYDIEISQQENWQNKHYETLKRCYSKATYFDDYHWVLKKIYLDKQWRNLSEFNIYVTKLLSEVLGINTVFVNSRDLNTIGTKDDKLLNICKKLNANHYLSGPAAKDYIEVEKFSSNNIELKYIEYNYPEYDQRFSEFDHHVSILDLLFNTGDKAYWYIWGWRQENDKI